MKTLPELVFTSTHGATIHKYQLTGGKRSFMRYLGCYLGSCKFFNELDDATTYIESTKPC
nr:MULTISPECIES: hypothetical protein [Prochlorococcus]